MISRVNHRQRLSGSKIIAYLKWVLMIDFGLINHMYPFLLHKRYLKKLYVMVFYNIGGKL